MRIPLPDAQNYLIFNRPSLNGGNACSLHKPSIAQPDTKIHAPSMAHIHSLPSEVLHMIFAYFINLTDYSGFGKFDPAIFGVAQVCKHWSKTAYGVHERSSGGIQASTKISLNACFCLLLGSQIVRTYRADVQHGDLSGWSEVAKCTVQLVGLSPTYLLPTKPCDAKHLVKERWFR